jgi:hypothetical protein
VGFRHVDARRGRSSRRGLDDEVLKRSRQQGYTRPNPKRQSNFQREHGGNENNREDASDEHQRPALGRAFKVLFAQLFLSNGVRIGVLVRDSAVREIVFT